MKWKSVDLAEVPAAALLNATLLIKRRFHFTVLCGVRTRH